MSNANNPPADAGMESLAAKEYMGELAYADKVLANCTEALQVLSSMMLNITETKGCNLRAGVMAADELIANVGEARKQIAKAAIHYVPAHYARAMPADAALVDEWNIEDLLATAVMYMRDVGMPNEADAIIELQSRNARLRALSQPATVAQVPEGFVLVPVEPTNRMMIAGAGSWVGWQESSMHDYLPTPDEVRDVYCAMLAASQSATGGA